ncbi:MAG: hypothetical protein AAGF12_05220 [Myxococcota bacterium]
MEPLLRPLATILISSALPLLLLAGARLLSHAPGAPRSVFSVGAWAAAGLAFVLGAQSLGPRLVASQPSWAGALFGVGCSVVCLIAAHRAERRFRAQSHVHDRTALLRPPTHVVGSLVGLGLVLGVAATAFAAHRVTRFGDDDPPGAEGPSASVRLFIDPWDGDAWVVRGWEARHRAHTREALVFAELAERSGADALDVLRLRSELAAARDDCEEANALFQRALTLQAERAFESGEALTLGGYELPPTLVERCPVSTDP